MTKLKCPFCNKKLDNDDLLYSCINEHCEESFDMVGTELLWLKVIDLQDDLIDTKKKLDRAIWWLNEIVENHRFTPISTAEKALKELKQKEEK